jgi:penicillin-binding protein 1C
VTLATLTNAYRTLANGGIAGPMFDVTAHASAALEKRIFSLQASFIVTNILADNNARTRTFGFDSVLATRFFSAVKTGTSKDMRDNWAVGYTSRYTVGVWVGNADGAPMWDVSGVTGAAPVWAALVNYLHRQTPSRAPVAPAGVVRTKIVYQNDIEPARDDWFLSGTEMSRIALSANAEGATARNGAARIATPTDGTIFALDPDIPAARQRVWFESAQGAPAGSVWRLDGKVAGPSAGLARMAWLPWPGHHTLELVDGHGGVVDSVKFEVRGAFAKIKTKG